jgi:hypothetical protein
VSLNPFDVVGRFMLGGFLIRVEVSPDRHPSIASVLPKWEV